MTVLPAAAYAAALARLPACGHHRLRALLEGGDAERAWVAVREGRLLDQSGMADGLGRQARDLAERWQREAVAFDVAAAWSGLREQGVGVWTWGGPGYPAALVDDPDPPPILFWRGDPDAVAPPAAAIVGTRRCTSYGADVARDLGRELASAGVAVVSGLALGIDGAAHEGALAGAGAAPVAVVGSGLDVVYPPRHRALWRRVAEAGLIISEAPLGSAPEAWRFPLRNRVIAGLAAAVVVVESHASGGSLSTVRAAADRGCPVLAVPGSVRSPSSAGTNRLLADGAAPAVDASDVLVALSLEGAIVDHDPRPAANAPAEPQLEGECSEVLDAVDWVPTATEDILRRTGLAPGAASAVLTRLEMHGLVRRRAGWWERVAPRP